MRCHECPTAGKCLGEVSPPLCLKIAGNESGWRALAQESSAVLSNPIPFDPLIAQAAERCPHRKDVPDDCCGLATKCIGGRKDGATVNIAVCASCYAELGPVS